MVQRFSAETGGTMNPENEIVQLSLFDWEQHKKEIADLRERVARLERRRAPLRSLPAVDLHALLSTDPDLTVYEIQPRDKEMQVGISVADLKTMLLAINVSSRRIHGLLKDLERAEARIDVLEQDS